MAIIDSETGAKAFLVQPPDWGERFSLELTFRTSTLISRNGTEQRITKRQKPKANIAYRSGPQASEDYSANRSIRFKEYDGAVISPLWVGGLVSTGIPQAQRFSFGVTITDWFFKSGDYAYITQTGFASNFAQITLVGTNYVDVSAVEIDPGPTIPAYTTGAKVWPCVTARRANNGAVWRLQNPRQASETIILEGL